MRDLILIAALAAFAVTSPQVRPHDPASRSRAAVDAAEFKPGPEFIFVPPIIAPAEACTPIPSMARTKNRKQQLPPRRRTTIEPIIVHHRQDRSSS